MPLELVILHSQTFDLNDAPDSGFNTDYSHFVLPNLQSSDFSEKSKANEIESNTEVAGKDDGEKEEISVDLAEAGLGDGSNRARSSSPAAPHSVEAAAETSSSNKGACEISDEQLSQEDKQPPPSEPAQIDGDMNTDAGVAAPEGGTQIAKHRALNPLLDDAAVLDVHSCSNEPGAAADPSCDQSVEQGIREEAVAGGMNDDGNPVSEVSPVEAHQSRLDAEAGENPSTVGENSGFHYAMDLERSHFDSAAPRDSNVSPLALLLSWTHVLHPQIPDI